MPQEYSGVVAHAYNFSTLEEDLELGASLNYIEDPVLQISR
jgi:hypothetical protein